MKTKKSLVVLAVITLVFALVFTTCSNGSTGGGGKDTGSTQGQLAFERITSGENAGTWRVRKGTFKGGALVIPAYYNGSTGRAARGVEDGDPVTEIGSREDDEWSAAFVRAGITSVTIPNTVKLIGQFAFGWNNELTSVIIPASVTEIWLGSFPACPNLAITVEDGNPHYSSEDGILYTNIKDPAYDFDEEGRGIPQYTDNNEKTVLHSYPSASGSVTIKEGVTRICQQAFYFSTGLTSVTIPSSVTEIGRYAFLSAYNLTSVTIPSSVTEIGRGAFVGTDLTSITIPASVASIGDSPFHSCKNLTSITVDSNNPNYSSEGGILYNKDKTTLLDYPSAKGNVTIKEGVTKIGWRVFYYCTSLTDITIPSSVTAIEWQAFAFCTNIPSITIPSSVEIMSIEVFAGWTSSQTINLPFANQAAADAAWEGWRQNYNGDDCENKAKINYNGS